MAVTFVRPTFSFHFVERSMKMHFTSLACITLLPQIAFSTGGPDGAIKALA